MVQTQLLEAKFMMSRLHSTTRILYQQVETVLVLYGRKVALWS
jgi:hypothetical protein